MEVDSAPPVLHIRTTPKDAGEALGARQLAHLDEIKNTQGWYDPDSHKRLRRLCLELVSEKPSCTGKVCEALVKALAEGMKRARGGTNGEAGIWERDPRGEMISIAGTQYENRNGLKEACQTILRSYDIEHPLNHMDLVLMKEVLSKHPRGEEKLRGCETMVVGMHPVHDARCFYVVRADGREDFSFLRCVQNTPTEEVDAQSQICDVLCKVLQLHPTASDMVAQVIEQNFPSYRGREGGIVERHRNWAHSILQLCTRMPMLSDFLLRILIRRMVEIDAAIHNLEEDVAADEAYGAGTGMEVAAGDDKESQLNAMAHILDAKMMVLFEFLQRHLAGSVGDPQQQLVSTLFGIFESIVLLTHRARCVQFLWFYMVSLRPAWTEAFLTLLLHTAFSTNTAIPKRLISLAYLASFISRAKFVTKNFALRTAQYVATLARENQHAAESLSEAGNTGQHPQLMLFLYAVQALCYVMCFHMHELGAVEPDDPTGRSALGILLYEGCAEAGAEPFAPVLESPSVPLARVNRQVAEQFCHCLKPYNSPLATALQQRLQQYAESVGSHLSQGEEAALEVFFPFDPYRLRHSSMFVSPIFRDWSDEESNIDAHEGFEGKAALNQPGGQSRSRGPSELESETSDADFTDAANAAERGFLPSVGPSPAFRPRGSTDMNDIMSPLILPMEPGYGDDDFLLPGPVVGMGEGENLLHGLLSSAAYREGGGGDKGNNGMRVA
mmetsp:Transcript_79264/g.164533  ORF Transcript_79264/g.164533 Transcript_79264/m.164533 type:complete len:726 (+) Transcript_79264:301-2478(+)|eukprot:CAMPEP_0206421578 /NCGR_PEP_ID=MMETSP0324_2-20121206/1528_1 /ASSEMBLY_ACC=CAM_ASM_000836 /TAXON_ID=2866 /ORGANISM="Crypthecodinium cohnii, Strain Seligo" /LENGTH=725 /DNA_ID=CAMNT_0053885693 /DNA_START=262 /DNA_END=2439 /DNA_ORIENTATION=-